MTNEDNLNNELASLESKIQKNLNMSADHAGEFFRNAIGINN